MAYCWNNVAKKRAYYGVPIEAQIMHIHYWRDLLKEAGMPDAPDKIPLKWDEYWDFWKKAQDALRKKDPAKYGKRRVRRTSAASSVAHNACRIRLTTW